MGPVPHQVIASAGRTSDRFRTSRREPDRRVRLLDRARNDGHVGELVETPLEGDVFFRPGAPNDLGAFLEPCAALAARNVKADEFGYAVTLSHTEIEAAV